MILENLVDAKEKKIKYGLILVDPPWQVSKTIRKSRGGQTKDLDYPTLTLEEIKDHLRQATELTEDNSILFLWTVEKYLFDAQRIAEELGYKLHARLIWDKVNGLPVAFTVKYGHEYLLYMYKGKLLPVAKDERGKIHSVFTEQNTTHSKKPQKAYQIIQRLYPDLKKLELYARNEWGDFDSWGNELDNKGEKQIKLL